jgi:hypothetical protein
LATRSIKFTTSFGTALLSTTVSSSNPTVLNHLTSITLSPTTNTLTFTPSNVAGTTTITLTTTDARGVVVTDDFVLTSRVVVEAGSELVQPLSGQSLTITGKGFLFPAGPNYAVTLTGPGCTSLLPMFATSVPSSTQFVIDNVDFTGCTGEIRIVLDYGGLGALPSKQAGFVFYVTGGGSAGTQSPSPTSVW